MKFSALIPARGGSKGVPNKNLREVLGKPLIAHTIEQARRVNIFDDVFVSTDSAEIASVAAEHGAACPSLRSPANSGDSSHMFPVYKEFLHSIQHSNYIFPDVLFVLLPTNLLRTDDDIIKIHSTWENDATAEWIFSCNEMEHHPYRAVRISPTNRFTPYFPIQRDLMWANRQEFPPAFRFNGAIISGKTSSILNNNEYPVDSFQFADTNALGVITSTLSAFDIDTELDLAVAQTMMESALLK